MSRIYPSAAAIGQPSPPTRPVTVFTRCLTIVEARSNVSRHSCGLVVGKDTTGIAVGAERPTPLLQLSL